MTLLAASEYIRLTTSSRRLLYFNWVQTPCKSPGEPRVCPQVSRPAPSPCKSNTYFSLPSHTDYTVIAVTSLKMILDMIQELLVLSIPASRLRRLTSTTWMLFYFQLMPTITTTRFGSRMHLHRYAQTVNFGPTTKSKVSSSVDNLEGQKPAV